MYGHAALVCDGLSASGAHDLCMGSHPRTVHYALYKSKCLLHRVPRYAEDMESPNDRLRKARLAKWKTQEEAAERMGVNLNTYRQHENDTRGLGGIPRRPAEHYARKLKVPLQWLLTGEGPDKEPDPVPSEDDLREMIQDAIEDVVTVNTRLADLPRIVAPALREQLERFRAGIEEQPAPVSFAEAKHAHDTRARSRGATKKDAKAG